MPYIYAVLFFVALSLCCFVCNFLALFFLILGEIVRPVAQGGGYVGGGRGSVTHVNTPSINFPTKRTSFSPNFFGQKASLIGDIEVKCTYVKGGGEWR